MQTSSYLLTTLREGVFEVVCKHSHCWVEANCYFIVLHCKRGFTLNVCRFVMSVYQQYVLKRVPFSFRHLYQIARPLFWNSKDANSFPQRISCYTVCLVGHLEFSPHHCATWDSIHRCFRSSPPPLMVSTKSKRKPL